MSTFKRLWLGAAASFLALVLAPAPASAETYTRDALGRITLVRYDDGSSIAYTYDAQGNVLGETRVAAPRPDAGPPDAGPTDAGPGPSDAGPPPTDAGPMDAGLPDAGLRDAGAPDSGPADAGARDTGTAERDTGPTEDAGEVAPDAGPAPKKDGGCGCRVADAAPGTGRAWLLVGLLVAWTAVRRRRRAPIRGARATQTP